MRLNPYFLDGVYLALGALPGAYAVVDSPRCEMERALKTSSLHDRLGDVSGDGPYARNRRLYAVNWTGGGDVRGIEDQLLETARTVALRHPGAPILLFRGFLSLVIHTDVHGVMEVLSRELKNPLALVDQPSLDDDWIDGYRQTNATLLRLLQRKTEPDVAATEDEALFCGYGCFRREADETGDVAEIERLWNALRLPPPRWPFNARPLSFAPLGPKAARVIFPYDFRHDEDGREAENGELSPLRVEAPYGVRRTEHFLRAIARCFGREDLAERFIEGEKRDLKARLLPAVSRNLAGKGAAVVADPWRAAGLVSALEELGVEIPLVLVLRKKEAGMAVKESLEARGAEILLDPALAESRDRLAEAAARGRIDAVVGAGVLRDAARSSGLAYVETGFPSYLEHFIDPAPVVGFRGLSRLAERLDQALVRREYLGRVDG